MPGLFCHHQGLGQAARGGSRRRSCSTSRRRCSDQDKVEAEGAKKRTQNWIWRGAERQGGDVVAGGGFLEGDKEQEFNGKIKRFVDNKESVSNCSDLNFAQLVPPYTISYTRNGRHLLLSGVEMCSGSTLRTCSLWPRISGLSFENRGLEVHCIKKKDQVTRTKNHMTTINYLIW